MPIHPIQGQGLYPSFPPMIPQGQVMYQYPIQQRPPEPTLLQTIRKYFADMDKTESLKFNSKGVMFYYLFMIAMSIASIGRGGAAGVVLMIFFIFSSVNQMTLLCSLSCKNVRRLECATKRQGVLLILGLYNVFLYILLGGFFYLRVRMFFLLLINVFLSWRNHKKLKAFRQDVVPLEWAQPAWSLWSNCIFDSGSINIYL